MFAEHDQPRDAAGRVHQRRVDPEELVELEVGRQRLHVLGPRTEPVRGVQLRSLRDRVAAAAARPPIAT